MKATFLVNLVAALRESLREVLTKVVLLTVERPRSPPVAEGTRARCHLLGTVKGAGSQTSPSPLI